MSVTSISVASPGVVTTGSNHLLKDGQQIKFTSPNFAVDSVAVTTDDIFTVRNTNGTTTFELFQADGTTAANVLNFFSTNLGKSTEESVKLTKQLAMMGPRIGISTAKITKDFQKSFENKIE